MITVKQFEQKPGEPLRFLLLGTDDEQAAMEHVRATVLGASKIELERQSQGVWLVRVEF